MSWGRMLVLGPGSTIPAQVPGTSMKTFLYGSRLKCSPTKMKIGAKHFSVLLCWYSMSTQIFKRKSFMVDSLIVWGLLSPRPRTHWPSPSPTCLSQQHSVQEFKKYLPHQKIFELTCDSFALLLDDHLAHWLVLLHLVLLVPRISLTSIQWWFWIFSKDWVDRCQNWGTLTIIST